MAAARNGSCWLVDSLGDWGLECRSEIAQTCQCYSHNQHTADRICVIERRRTNNCQHRVRKVGKYKQGDCPRGKQHGPLPVKFTEEDPNDTHQPYRFGYQRMPSQIMYSSGSRAQRRYSTKSSAVEVHATNPWNSGARLRSEVSLVTMSMSVMSHNNTNY